MNIHNKTGDELATAQAIVSMHAVDSSSKGQATDTVHRIEQVGSQFIPFISAVQKGSSIKFPNRDSFAHHVYSFSEPAKFQSELYSQQESHEIAVNKPGVIVVGCNIHDWMLAYVYVVDTPHFAQPLNNQVRFENLEPGAYLLSYWHPSMPAPVQSNVEIKGAAKSMQLSVNLKRIEQIQAPSHSFHEDDDY
ncbi:MAG: hypothetical protein AB8B48_12010 [Pseudomonadales bacterium]